VISDERRVAERTAVLGRALDLTADLAGISDEVADRAQLTDVADRRAVVALVDRVVDEPAHTDILWAWVVGISTLPDEAALELVTALQAIRPHTPPRELLERIAITIRLAINTM
jgi:hypothetical protein